MRDEETGSYWQQASGRAIGGPMKGQTLEGVHSDELSFALWKQEAPTGQVMAPVAAYESKYESNWEPEVQKFPTPFQFPGSGVQPRDLVLGIVQNGASRAYPMSSVLADKPVQDTLAGTPVLLVMGPDRKSVRAFVSRIHGQDAEFFRQQDSNDWALIDSVSGSKWSFAGCAVSGPNTGACLTPVDILKDYWFDWKNYHPDSSVYRH